MYFQTSEEQPLIHQLKNRVILLVYFAENRMMYDDSMELSSFSREITAIISFVKYFMNKMEQSRFGK